MGYLPMSLDVSRRRCLVVGGGSVGTRRAAALLAAGATVVVVAPRVSERLREDGSQALLVRERPYRRSDLTGIDLAFSCTGDAAVDGAVARDAAGSAVLLCTASAPEGDFSLSAVVRRDPVTVAISTSGKAPALARELARRLEGSVGSHYAVAAQILDELRRGTDGQLRVEAGAYRRLFTEGFLELLEEGREADARHLAGRLLGPSNDTTLG